MPESIRQQRVFNRNHRLATTTGDLEHSRAIRSVTLAKLLCRAFCPHVLQPKREASFRWRDGGTLAMTLIASPRR